MKLGIRRLLWVGLCAQIMLSCGSRSSISIPNSSTSQDLIYVRVPSALLTKDFVQMTGFNRDHAKDAFFSVGWISAAALQALPTADRTLIAEIDEQAVAQGRLNPFTMRFTSVNFDEDKTFEDYHNFEDLTAELQQLAVAYPDITQLTSVGTSFQGRQLWMMTISDNIDAEESEPKLLYIANMHGDEVVGRELSIYHIRRLLSEYGKSPRLTNLVNNSKIYIIPSMNPDGFELKRRHSAQQLDLNRNFPDFSNRDTDNPAGRGVETQAIMALHEQHHFTAAVNFHGGEVCFNLPWDTSPNRYSNEKFGDDTVLNPMGRAWADSNPTMRANSSFDNGLTYGYEWYEVDGGMQDWSIWYRRSMHATVELSYAKWPPASYLATAWRDNQEAMLAFHERALTGIHLEVVYADGTPVPSFDVSVQSANRTIRYDDGIAHRTTTEGLQNVSILVAGKPKAQISTMARPFDGRYDRVVITN